MWPLVEVGEGVVCGLNDGGAAAAAKIIFIAMNEKSDFWADEFPR